MDTIARRGKTYEIPSDINQLPPEQYEEFLSLSILFSAGAVSGSELRRRWLSSLIGMRDYSILLPEYTAELDRQLTKISGFFMPDGSPDLRTSRNLLPEYKGYRGPADSLNGLPFGVFVESLTVLMSMSEGDGSEEARHIARLLYGIPEEEEVPPLLLYHAPRLIANVWNMIQAAPVEINGEPIDFRIIFRTSGGKGRADDRTGWIGITFEIAEKGLFGPVSEVEKADMWAVLIYLYKCKFEYNQEMNRK